MELENFMHIVLDLKHMQQNSERIVSSVITST